MPSPTLRPFLVRFCIAALLLAAAAPAPVAVAANGDCGIPFTSGSEPKTSDCLFILRAGVGLQECPLCTCDTNGNLAIAASDALLCLRVAVGQNLALVCPACATTTTLPPDTTTTTLIVVDTTTTTTLPPDTTTTTLPVVDTTTTTLPDTTTTTTMGVETTTTSTSTTTLPPSGGCPGSAEWITRARRGIPCSVDADCGGTTCDDDLGLCRGATDFDLGWTGFGHDGDLDGGSRLRVFLSCGEGDAPCGSCEVAGLDPSAGNCRCANDPRRRCDEPYETDFDDCPTCLAGAFVGSPCTNNADCAAGSCGRRCSNDNNIICTKNGDCSGGTCVAQAECTNGKPCSIDLDCTGTCQAGSQCQCYGSPPVPLSMGSTPFCYVERITSDVTGTVDVDSGASAMTRSVFALMYTGISNVRPCPVCGGRCSNDAGKLCVYDVECTPGTCVRDSMADDGSADGFCVGGRSNGLSCDVQAVNSSFPPQALGGGGSSSEEAGAGGSALGVEPSGVVGYSLDCMPDTGKNISGTGLGIRFEETTGDTQIPFDLPCGSLYPELSCPCLVCSGDTATGCSSNADCTPGKGECTVTTATTPLPNQCTDFLCTNVGNFEGLCTTGPDDRWCDGIVKADGKGFLSCAANADCQPAGIGIDAGNCTLLQRRECFLDPLVAYGTAHPRRPITAAAFCARGTSVAGRNAVIGLPGPGRLRRQSDFAAYCASAPEVPYMPKSGNCPP